MGKQINYYMGYEDFRMITKKALECGCRIVKSVEGQIVQSTSIDFVTDEEKQY